MKIFNYKKKCITLSLVLIMVGALIFSMGYGMEGFRYNNLIKDLPKDAWYSVIHMNKDGNLWLGIDIGNNMHFLSLGAAD